MAAVRRLKPMNPRRNGDLTNTRITEIRIETPPGCMGECDWHTARMLQSGALEYCGRRNAVKDGDCKGSVNLYTFDMIANVILESGFLDVPPSGNDYASTMGRYSIDLVIDGQQRNFQHDAAFTPPLFWAVVRLVEMMVGNAKWGEDHYNEAVATYPSRLDGSYYRGAKR
ncbi:hypothetical protein Poly51_59400 [Rubripirellula tenax]|uniref:Uncharacterized protein n=2 Tax=Rubripirellula tenax TaxID=2528015 RepID=A0A5C6EA84_9BACT|nr:hypothetical protein Poly51_59400 [Rubripirellula tenax]